MQRSYADQRMPVMTNGSSKSLFDKKMPITGPPSRKIAGQKAPVVHNLLLRGSDGRPTPRDASSTRAAAALQSSGAVEAR